MTSHKLKRSQRSALCRIATVALALFLGTAATTTVTAATLTTLVNFNYSDGADPYAPLIMDATGNLYGTTNYTGPSGYGTVFEIANTPSGYASAPTTLVSFNGSNGSYPGPGVGLAMDPAGNLYGTTGGGGSSNAGTVFEIARTSGGYSGTPTTLVNFNNSNGAGPAGGLSIDAAGNLYGITGAGGSANAGTVFEIARTSSGYASTPTTLVSFNGSNGASPSFGVIMDAAGNLYGTTGAGGSSNDGTVYEIARTSSGYANTPTTLASFTGGMEPVLVELSWMRRAISMESRRAVLSGAAPSSNWRGRAAPMQVRPAR